MPVIVTPEMIAQLKSIERTMCASGFEAITSEVS